MKKTFTLFLFALMFVNITTLVAQIPLNSPFPVDTEVTSPASIAGSFDYGSMSDTDPAWGIPLSETVSGELAWADDGTDSLACFPLTNDLTGKIAFIRRGACGFSLKTWHAQEAGAVGVIIVNHYDTETDAATTLYSMLGGDSAHLVNIPAIFVSRQTGELIAPVLDSGTPVNVSFTVRSFKDPIGPYAYSTPASQITPLENISVGFINLDQENTFTVTATIDITGPDGSETLSSTLDVGPLGDSTFLFDSYTPNSLGTYTMTYSNDQNEETFERIFEVSDFTYATDDNNILGGVGPSDADFLAANLIYHAGSIYFAGADGGIATHASFGVENVDEMFTGDADADVFNIVFYDADADEDDVVDLTTSFEDLTAVAIGSYVMTGNEEPNSLITVELESLLGDAVELKPNGAYYVTVQYNGTNAGIGISPKYTSTAAIDYPNFPTTPIIIDQLYTGWSTRTVVTRLHVDGFVGTKDLPKLDASKIQLAPNPTVGSTQLTFDLAEVADEVQVRLLDFSGRLISTNTYENVKNNTFTVNVSQLPAGTYFLSILTPEGYRAEKLVIGK